MPNAGRCSRRRIVQLIAILERRVREKVSRQDGRGVEGHRQIVDYHDTDGGDRAAGRQQDADLRPARGDSYSLQPRHKGRTRDGADPAGAIAGDVEYSLVDLVADTVEK